MEQDNYTIDEQMLITKDGVHTLYVQQWGNANGTPILFLHGGPGSGCHDGHKQLFNPLKHYVIFFDQRGAGRSEPHGSLEENTTQKLIEDIELIRETLKIEKWVVFGRSWGSALSMCYAITHPSAIEAIVTGGVYLSTTSEHDHMYKGTHLKAFYPETWLKYLNQTPVEHHDNPGLYHRAKILGSNESEAIESALTYSSLLSVVMSIDERTKAIEPEDFDLTSVKIELHYQLNNSFVEENFIIKNAASVIAPVYIAQGTLRYHMPAYSCLPIASSSPEQLIDMDASRTQSFGPSKL